MNDTEFLIAVVMQRQRIENRWQSEAWDAAGVVPQDEEARAAPRVIFDDGRLTQWLYPGMRLVLLREHAEGYYLNASAQRPSVFVMWGMEGGLGVPQAVSLSYDEASTWMDAGEQVSAVAMAPELLARMRQYVQENYRPQPKKRLRPQSFRHPRDRS